MTSIYAVFGNPIAHSQSPNIHRQFCEQTGENMSYTKQMVVEDGFKAAADEFFKKGGDGLNITMPCKLAAFHYAEELTARARSAGAVNTLLVGERGQIIGDNTDGVGMVNDMLNLGWSFEGKNVLILGAGGAVRGVLEPVLGQPLKTLTIANRTMSKAQQLALDFKTFGPVIATSYKELEGQKFDIVINATSTSLTGGFPPLPQGLLADNACCYDMTYSPEPTTFVQWAEENGAYKAVDGLGMLVGQAAESFFAWRHLRPEVVPVINQLRRSMKESKR